MPVLPDRRAVATIARPPADAAADATNTKGSSRRAACQAGVAVSESSTPVYEASAGGERGCDQACRSCAHLEQAAGDRNSQRQHLGDLSSSCERSRRPERREHPGTHGHRRRGLCCAQHVEETSRAGRGRESAPQCQRHHPPRPQCVPSGAASGRPRRSAPAARSDEPAARPPRKK